MNEPDRTNFSPEYVERELIRLDKVLNEKLNVYLLGGAVMAMDGLKAGTRDIDVLIEDGRSHDILVRSLEKCDYYLLQPQDLSKPYQELSATALENIDRFRWEIFIKYVAKKLALTDTMMQRADEMFSGRNLTVFRLSKEDIFLMKGMTERDRDLEDMSLIAKSGIDYNLVFDECIRQSDIDLTDHIWEASLNEKLRELESSYGIRSPIRKKLEKIAEEKMLVAPIVKILQLGSLDQGEIMSELPEMGLTDIEDGLKILVNSGRIRRLKDGKFSLVPNSKKIERESHK